MKKNKMRINSSKLTSSLEDYIRTIYSISLREKVVRVKDISREMKRSMPSVCNALMRLKEYDMVKYEKYSFITITEKGIKAGYEILKRKHCIFEFLVNVLNIDDNKAGEIACGIEHYLTDDVYEKLSRFLTFYYYENNSNKDWVFRYKKVTNFNELHCQDI